MRKNDNFLFKEERICRTCKEPFTANNPKTNTCLGCRNIERALQNTGNSDKDRARFIVLHNGLEILNNAAGKEVAHRDRTNY